MKKLLLGVLALAIFIVALLFFWTRPITTEKNAIPHYSAADAVLSTEKTITPVFTINLPVGMKLTHQEINKETNTYDYTFQSSPYDDTAREEIDVLVKPAEHTDLDQQTLEPAIEALEKKYHIGQTTKTDRGTIWIDEAYRQQMRKSTFGQVWDMKGRFSLIYSLPIESKAYSIIGYAAKGATYTITLINGNRDEDEYNKNRSALFGGADSIEFLGIPEKKSVASSDYTTSTPTFKVNLPATMKLTHQTVLEDKREYFYTFEDPTQHVDIKVIPESIPDGPNAGSDLLEGTIYGFKSDHNLGNPVSDVHKRFRASLFYFTSRQLSFDGLDVDFLATAADGAYYIITLSSTDKDPLMRRKQIDDLTTLVTHMDYLGMSNPTPAKETR